MDVQSDIKCTICLDRIEKNSTFLRCAHQFHCTCINRWFRNHKTCPNCRTPRDDDIPMSQTSSDDETVEEGLYLRDALESNGNDSDVETVVIEEGEEYSDSEMGFAEDDRLSDDRSEHDSDSTSEGTSSFDEYVAEMSSDEAALSIYVDDDVEPTPTEGNVYEDNATG